MALCLFKLFKFSSVSGREAGGGGTKEEQTLLKPHKRWHFQLFILSLLLCVILKLKVEIAQVTCNDKCCQVFVEIYSKHKRWVFKLLLFATFCVSHHRHSPKTIQTLVKQLMWWHILVFVINVLVPELHSVIFQRGEIFITIHFDVLTLHTHPSTNWCDSFHVRYQ